jgi:cytochrome c
MRLFAMLVSICAAIGLTGFTQTAHAQTAQGTSTSAIASRAQPSGAQLNGAQLNGERLFLQCRSCHSLNTNQAGKVGPALGGMFTRPVASAAGFAYSPGLKAFSGTWSDARLDAYLTNPARIVPGNKMAFAGMPDAARRAALIAYLRANTGQR